MVKALGISKTGITGANQLRLKLREIRAELINGTADIKQISENPILRRWLMKLVRYKKADNFTMDGSRDDARFTEILETYIKHQETALKLPAGYERSGELSIQKSKKGAMSLELVPGRNILTEFSGFLADACYFQSKGSLLKEYPNVVSVTMVKNPGQASEALVGNILLIETKGVNGEPLLVVRGYNPQQNIINQLDMASFHGEVMSYLHKIARRRGRKLAMVIENQSNMATTNRPNFFAYLKAQKPDLQKIWLKSHADTTINGHNIMGKTFLVKSAQSVDMAKVKPETKQKVDKLERQLKRKGVLKQAEDIDTYITNETIKQIENPQPFQQVLRVKNTIIAFNKKGQAKVFESPMAYEKYLDAHKVLKTAAEGEKEKSLKQKVETPSESGDKHTIDATGKRFVDSDLPTTYAELSKLSKAKLGQYGITTPKQLTRFKKYIKYVKRIEKQLAKLEIQFAHDRKALEVIMNQISISTNAILVKKPSLKNRVRMTRKLLKELNGKFEKLTDITRGSITFSNHRDLYRALRLLKANPEVQKLKIKDFLNVRNPDGTFDLSKASSHKSGFRHINIKIRLKSGRVVELQLHLKEVHKAAVREVDIPTGLLQDIQFTKAQKELFEKTAARIKKDGGPTIEFPDFTQPRQKITEQHIYNILREIITKKGGLTETEKGLVRNIRLLSKKVYNYSWTIYKSKHIS